MNEAGFLLADWPLIDFTAAERNRIEVRASQDLALGDHHFSKARIKKAERENTIDDWLRWTRSTKATFTHRFILNIVR